MTFLKKKKLPKFINQVIPYVVRDHTDMEILKIPTDLKMKEAVHVGHMLLTLSENYNPYEAQKYFNKIFSRDKQLRNIK